MNADATGRVNRFTIANATIPSRIDASPVPTTGQPGQSARASLPQTASMMPVAALVGCLTLFAGIGLWAWRRYQA